MKGKGNRKSTGVERKESRGKRGRDESKGEREESMGVERESRRKQGRGEKKGERKGNREKGEQRKVR